MFLLAKIYIYIYICVDYIAALTYTRENLQFLSYCDIKTRSSKSKFLPQKFITISNSLIYHHQKPKRAFSCPNVVEGPETPMLLGDRVMFMVLRYRIFFRVLKDTVVFSVLSDRIFFRFFSKRVLFRVFFSVRLRDLFRVLNDRALLNRILSDRLLFRVVSDRFAYWLQSPPMPLFYQKNVVLLFLKVKGDALFYVTFLERR